ncbi:MAG: GyrI-like domain-containing protein [Actinobacteria bacterium]|nr:GyrI-like domain-containing protein [Actinomycetota bacterium]
MAADLKQRCSELYEACPDPALIEVPSMQFLMCDGTSPLGDENFQRTIEALNEVAITLRSEQKASGMDFQFMPVEGFYEIPDRWTLAIRVPAQITPDHVNRAKAEAAEKRDLSQLGSIRLEEFWEGQAVQAQHVGPYDDVSQVIEKIQAFIAEKGMISRGRLHELYMSDPARTPPAELLTILRQPCA